MSEAIVEIRDYTIEPEHFQAYRNWATEFAAPWLRANLDLIDFWMDVGLEAEVSGSNPRVSENGQPNVTWIIRWASKAERDANFRKTMGREEWKAIWALHPCPNGYLQMNARFLRSSALLQAG